MNLCAACGMEASDGLCRHHALAAGDDWSEGNRILCDFFHRHIAIERLPADLREHEEIRA
jgi:hypothetical protein